MRSIVLTAVLAFATTARAETRTEHYGKTIAIADGISVATLATGVGLIATHDSGGLRATGIVATAVGAGGYIWASPIVHHLRDRGELTKIDIGLRILIPGLAGGIAAGATSCPDTDNTCRKQLVAAAIGGGAGIVVMSALDIAVFAQREVTYVAPTPGGAVVGITGRF